METEAKLPGAARNASWGGARGGEEAKVVMRRLQSEVRGEKPPL